VAFIAAVFETGDPGYRWINSIQAAGKGILSADLRTVEYSEQAGWSYEAGRTVVPVAARPRSSGLHVEVISNGPLSIAGPEHNDELRVADLRQVLHDGSLMAADIGQIARRLPEDSPARAQAVARAGGPLIGIIEHTAPDEAADTLIDFPDLPQRYDIPLQHAPTSLPGRPYVIHAATRIDVAADTDVCFAYFSSDPVEIRVDGKPLEADVTGNPPAWFYDPHPRARRSAPVRLTAGAHTLLFRCAKAADLPWPQWCLSVSAQTLDGDVALAVTASAR